MQFSPSAPRLAGVLVATVLLGCAIVPLPTGHARSRRPAPRLDRIEEVFDRYELMTLDPAAVAAEVRATGRFTLATRSRTFELALSLHDMRSTNYRAEDVADGGIKAELERSAPITFAGYAVNADDVRARFSIDDDKITGLILTPDEWYFVERLQTYSLAGGPTDYVFYAGSDVNPASYGTCATSAAERVDTQLSKLASEPEALASPNRFVELATEADYEFVSALGGATNANNEILTVMNQVEGVYQNEVALAFDIVYQQTWSTSQDPYSSTNASTVLNEFGGYWNANMGGVTRDLAHQWTGRDLDGSTMGIAWIGVVCYSATNSYGVSQRYTANPGKYILTAHEMGHNFSAAHSDGQSGCSNTIMGGSVGSGFTFCQYSRNQIISWVNGHSSCMTYVPTTNLGVFDTTTGTFFLRNSTTPGAADAAFSFGGPGTTPLAGDWDGNKTQTAGIYDPPTASFFLKNANAPGPADIAFSYGPAGMIPLAGDWDGNETQTIGIFDPTTATFFLRNANSPGPADSAFAFGPANAGFLPVAGDWDGDGDDTVGVYNPVTGVFFLKNSNTPGAADVSFGFGAGGAWPLAGDWTGVGHDGVGIYFSGTGSFFLRSANSAGPADVSLAYGPPNLRPVVGDWNGQ